MNREELQEEIYIDDDDQRGYDVAFVRGPDRSLWRVLSTHTDAEHNRLIIVCDGPLARAQTQVEV